MRALLIPTLLVILATGISAQNDDRKIRAALRRLDSLQGMTLRDWRFKRANLKNGGAVDLDDSSWRVVSPPHRWQVENKNAWYRLNVVIPEDIAGLPIAGSKVYIRVGADDYGEVWVNGEKRTDFEWDKGRVMLTEKAKPGDTFFVAVLVKNRGGPGRLLSAKLHSSALDVVSEKATAYVDTLRIARKIVRTFGGPDRRGKEHIAASAAAVDLDALAKRDIDKFVASLDGARLKLAGLKELTKNYRVHAVGYSHIDLAWLWRWTESIQVCKETFEQALRFFDEFPDFRFSMSQSHAYRWMEKRYPELYKRIEAAVKSGKWEIVGGTNVELDCNLPGAESHIRQILHGKRYFREKFGKDIRIGWCPDSFGYNINLPQILKKSGMDYFVTAKISWNDTNDFPHNFFRWEAPDGSSVLAFLPMGGYTFNMDGAKLVDHIARLEKQTGLKRVMSVYGVGNHGGGPTRAEIERARKLKATDFYPKVEFSSALRYFESFNEAERAKLPVWKSELYLEYHRGTYTTQADTKKANRKGECGLTTAEKVASMARLLRKPYPKKRLEKAWDLLLFNQMHDILPGSSITPVYRDTKRDYNRMHATINRTVREGLAAVNETLDAEHRQRVVVFNPLSWQRRDVVEAQVDDEGEAHWRVVDHEGAPVPSQMVERDDGGKAVAFLAVGVPAVGYKAYYLRPAEKAVSGPTTPVKATRTSLENAYLKVKLDPKTGNIVSLVHKPTGREAIAEGGQANQVQLHEDKPKHYDAWNLGLTGKNWMLDEPESIELIESGPVRAVIRVKRAFLGATKKRRHPTEGFPSSFFTQDITLEHGVPRLKVRMKADWWEEHICAKVAFPLSVDPKMATYEAPYAHIDRSTRRDTDWEKARYEVSAQKWADMSQDGFGVALLNDSKYGYDALHNVIRLTMLRSPTSPDPVADRGQHDFVYALYPHGGDWRQSLTVRQGYELNYPLAAQVLIDRNVVLMPMKTRKMLPAGGKSFVSVDQANVVVPVWKKHEDSDAHVIRLYEWEGRDTEATLTLGFAFKKAYLVNLMEGNRQELPVNDGKVKVKLGKYAIETVLVE